VALVAPTQPEQSEQQDRNLTEIGYQYKVRSMAETPSEIDTEAFLEHEYLDGQQLVDRIAQAGPGAVLRVRVIDPVTHDTYVGTTTWTYEDLGPAVLHWKDPRSHDCWDRMLLLGGNTFYPYASMKGMAPYGNNTDAYSPVRRRISREAQLRQFEILDNDNEYTKEEKADIAKITANEKVSA
jgi:hypothetical protein